MEKLDKLGTGNVPIPPKYTKPVVAGELNEVIDKVNELVDDLTQFKDVTSTAYTLILTDQNKYIKADNADAITITVPTYADVAIPIGAGITIEQTGVGTVTVAGDTGVTINGNLSTGGQYMIVVLIKTAINTWTCIGGV